MCITYICLAIVLGGLAGYCKVVLSDVSNNTTDEKGDKSSENDSTNSKDGANNNSNSASNSKTDDNKSDLSNAQKDDSKKKQEEYDEKPPNLTYDELHSKLSGNSSIIPIPIKVELTAYCNCAICSEAWGSETAMQTHTRVGVVAAPKEIPLGSTVYIPELKDYKSDGIFKVEDRGGAVVVKNDGTYIIDVWLPTHDEVKKFGRKKTLVFLTK